MLDPFSPSSFAYLLAITSFICAVALTPVALFLFFGRDHGSVIHPPPNPFTPHSKAQKILFFESDSMKLDFCPAFSINSVHFSNQDSSEGEDDPFPLTDSSEYACVARATISCLRRIRPEIDISLEMTLVAELDLSHVQIANLTKSIFSATGREHQPGMYRKEIVTVEDLVLYITVSPQAKAALPPVPIRGLARRFRKAA